MSEINPRSPLHSNDGIAHLKQQYLIPDEKLNTTEGPPNDNKANSGAGGHVAPSATNSDPRRSLFPSLVDVKEGEPLTTCPNETCEALHSIKDFLAQKPPDVSSDCPVFNLRGHCPKGITCRFGSGHITPEGRNKVNQKLHGKFLENPSGPINGFNKDLQANLQNGTYDFRRSEVVLKRLVSEDKTNENANGTVPVPAEKKTFGSVTDEDVIKTRQSEKKKIDWKGKLSLPALSTMGNLPFRRICKGFGADVTCCEMMVATKLLQGDQKEWDWVQKHSSEDIYGAQVCGSNPYELTKVAQLLEDRAEVNFVEINIGCPKPNVTKEGGGCALMRRPQVLQSIVECVSETLNVPLTIKARTGFTADESLIHTFMPGFREWGASLVTVHGRSKEQRYTGGANWSYINECASLASPLSVFGNGDVFSYEGYNYVMDTYENITGVAIARGALIKPWIFTEIKEQRSWDISSRERLDILRGFVNNGLEHWGTDETGVATTRSFLLEWLLFLHRYVPVGLLERLPQRINEKPLPYYGRDELETLMASSNLSDWIKISEMLLGPVPDGFTYTLKHRINAY